MYIGYINRADLFFRAVFSALSSIQSGRVKLFCCSRDPADGAAGTAMAKVVTYHLGCVAAKATLWLCQT